MGVEQDTGTMRGMGKTVGGTLSGERGDKKTPKTEQKGRGIKSTKNGL